MPTLKTAIERESVPLPPDAPDEMLARIDWARQMLEFDPLAQYFYAVGKTHAELECERRVSSMQDLLRRMLTVDDGVQRAWSRQIRAVLR